MKKTLEDLRAMREVIVPSSPERVAERVGMR
jgi:hypothetical protein